MQKTFLVHGKSYSLVVSSSTSLWPFIEFQFQSFYRTKIVRNICIIKHIFVLMVSNNISQYFITDYYYRRLFLIRLLLDSLKYEVNTLFRNLIGMPSTNTIRANIFACAYTLYIL